jgi:phage/plasmid-associated DNA primase/phage/plasmid primase-like uncharacterized protein
VSDFMQKFKQTISERGMECPENILPDGRFYRAGKNDRYWAVISNDGLVFFGAFGDWVTGESHHYHSSVARSMPAEKKKEIQDRINALKEIVSKEKMRLASEAAQISKQRWFFAEYLDNHPYLKAKGIVGSLRGAKVDKETNAILIPVLNTEGEITSLQSIYPDGSKYFEKNGIVSGGYFIIEGNSSDVVLCEGFATGCAINESTGKTVIVCFNAGNIEKVANFVKTVMKKACIIAADNDWENSKNPGLTKAEHAGKKFGFKVVVPDGLFPKESDFCDLFVRLGKSAVEGYFSEKTLSIPVEKTLFDVTDIDEETTNQSMVSEYLSNSTNDRVFYDPNFDQWWVFENNWKKIAEIEFTQKLMDVLSLILKNGYSYAFLISIKNMLKVTWARNSADFDSTKVPFLNGYLDLKNKNFHPHSVDVFFDWHIPCEYATGRETPTCDEVFHNLAGGNASSPEYESKIQILKCFLAATLRGMSHMQKYLELIGDPGAGKSTYIQIAMMLVGQQNCHSSSLQILHRSSWETSMFFGKRLVVFPDEDDFGGKGDILKSATGGDPLRYEPKGKSIGTSFVYRGMIIVSANNYIQFSDKSHAMVRRRIPIKIEHSVPENKQDRHIMSKIAKEIPALINRLLEISIEEIESSLSSTMGLYREESINSYTQTNVVARWMTENCEFDPSFVSPTNSSLTGVFAEKKSLYCDFREYCQMEGERFTPSVKSFAAQIRAASKVIGKDISQTRTKNWKGWKGVQVREKSKRNE